MRRPLIALFFLVATVASAQHVIDQATFPPDAAYAPSVAVSLDNYTAIAYVTETEAIPEPQVAVQLVPTNPDTDEIWPDPVFFGPGSEPRICWSRDGFTLAFVSADAVLIYQSDLAGTWDHEDPEIIHPGGVVIGLDLWGVPTDAAGHAVFLSIDDSLDPPDNQCRVHFTSRSSYWGWSELQTLVDGIGRRPGSQVSWVYGPAGPWPAVYYLTGSGWEAELYRIFMTDTGWTAPLHVPGDGASGPTSFESSFDVARSADVGIVGLGAQPTCPCGSIHFLKHDDVGGWQPEERITVDHGYYDWPFSPHIDMGLDGVMHLFWYQLTSGSQLDPRTDHLEYWIHDDGAWTNAGHFLEHLDTGIGWRVDIGVSPNASASVLAWSHTDTIDGEPQLEQIFMARSTTITAVANNELSGPAVGLSVRPNPFNPSTTLAYSLPAPGRSSVSIYDTRGRSLRTLRSGYQDAGLYETTWDGCDTAGRAMPSGVYFARFECDAGESMQKLVLVR